MFAKVEIRELRDKIKIVSNSSPAENDRKNAILALILHVFEEDRLFVVREATRDRISDKNSRKRRKANFSFGFGLSFLARCCGDIFF